MNSYLKYFSLRYAIVFVVGIALISILIFLGVIIFSFSQKTRVQALRKEVAYNRDFDIRPGSGKNSIFSETKPSDFVNKTNFGRKNVLNSESIRELTEKEYFLSSADFVNDSLNFYKIDSANFRLTKLAESEIHVDFAYRALTDSYWVRVNARENQAATRIFSIKILSEKAKLGDLNPIEKTLSKLSEKINSLDKGQKADLRDLISEYISIKGPETFKNDPSIVMGIFSNPKSIKSIVIAAAVAHLGEEINDPDFAQSMRKWN